MLEWIVKFYGKIRKLIRYNVGFSKAIPFIIGLIFSKKFVENALLSILITYLNGGEWDMGLRRAVTVINLIAGVEILMAILIFGIVDLHFDLFKVVSCCSIAFLVGLINFMIDTHTSTNHKKRWVLYIALGAISMGKVGLNYDLQAFVTDQFKAKYSPENPVTEALEDEHNNEAINTHIMMAEDKIKSQAKVRGRLWWQFASSLSSIIALFVFYTAEWKTVSIYSSSFMGISCFVFFIGRYIGFYSRSQPSKRKSPFILAYRVFMAALSKIRMEYPLDLSELHKRSDDPSVPSTHHFKWLNKAAIVEEESKGRLCTVWQVEETKSLLKMVPMWITFIMYGAVLSGGDTLYYLQADEMDTDVGNFEVPLFLGYVIQSFLTYTSSFLWDLIFQKKKRYLLRIWFGMLFSILSPLAAYLVRLKQNSKDGNETTGITIFWLVPQFCFLGAMRGLAEYGLEDFFNTRVSEEFKYYGPILHQFWIVIGYQVTTVIVNATSSVYKDDIPPLGLCFLILIVCTTINNIIYVLLVYICYYKEEKEKEEVEVKVNATERPGAGSIIWDALKNLAKEILQGFEGPSTENVGYGTSKEAERKIVEPGIN